MAERTAISWCDHTWNPWIGCTKVSPGCDHCYAEALATQRLGVAWGPHAMRRRTAVSTWNNPRTWNRRAAREGVRRRVFCASLADVFDNQVPDDWRRDLWQLIAETPHLDWQLLTKRPQNISRMLPDGWGQGWANVWLGTSVENQAEADRRAPLLQAIPAALRFFSAEPLLSGLELAPWLGSDGFGWVIAGGESGPDARPMYPDWARGLRDQCAAAGVPFHFKQWGEWVVLEEAQSACGGLVFFRPGKAAAGRLLDGCEHLSVPPSLESEPPRSCVSWECERCGATWDNRGDVAPCGRLHDEPTRCPIVEVPALSSRRSDTLT